MKKNILVCDKCGNEVSKDGATLRMNYLDVRKGSKVADLCTDCASDIPGHAAARRGRPKSE